MKRFIFQKLALFLLVGTLIYLQGYHPKTVTTSGTEQKTKLAVIMYHGFTDTHNESTYVINAKKLEDDIIYLKNNGFSFVTPGDLTNFCDYGTPLPEKCVMLTFDDGYLNNYLYAYPIIKKHNTRVTISPIAYYTDYHTNHHDPNPAYAHMTWSQLKEMSDSGLCDIQNHSYNMHSLQNGRKGSARAVSETPKDYREAFLHDLFKAHSSVTQAIGKEPIAYAYPFGSISYETRALLKCCGYRVSFSCEEGYNYITRHKDSLYMLKRFNRSNEKNVATILADY